MNSDVIVALLVGTVMGILMYLLISWAIVVVIVDPISLANQVTLFVLSAALSVLGFYLVNMEKFNDK